MQGIYVMENEILKIWWSIDDFHNGFECDMFLKDEVVINKFLSYCESEEDVFYSAQYLELATA